MDQNSSRPRGRRPGKADTRAEIIAAALRLFSATGYEKVSIRAIAREAEVDPALVHHYFENKAALFAVAVLDRPLDADAIVRKALAGPSEQVGERVLGLLLAAWSDPHTEQQMEAMLRAAASAKETQRPLSEFLIREIMLKIAEAHGHTNARFRAETAVSILLGIGLCRSVLAFPGLVKARNRTLATSLGKAIQTQLVDRW